MFAVHVNAAAARTLLQLLRPAVPLQVTGVPSTGSPEFPRGWLQN